jgi:hypothetical protein
VSEQNRLTHHHRPTVPADNLVNREHWVGAKDVAVPEIGPARCKNDVNVQMMMVFKSDDDNDEMMDDL